MNDGADDTDPERDDDHESKEHLVHAKEQWRPCQVEDELAGEPDQGGALASAGVGVGAMPDDGQGNSDQRIEGDPNGTEDPVRRRPHRFVEPGVPFRDLAARDRRAHASKDFDGDDGDENLDPEGHGGRYVESEGLDA